MDNELHNNEILINGCLRNDRHSQELLYRKYAGKMYGICLSYTGDREEAQDILQEGFVKVFRNIKSYSSQGSFEGWIRKIIVNTAIDYLRGRKQGDEFIEMENIYDHTDYHNVLDDLALSDILDQIKNLPRGARMVFNLYAVEGYSHKEIARILNINEGTSKSQFNRARSILTDLLEKLQS